MCKKQQYEHCHLYLLLGGALLQIAEVHKEINTQVMDNVSFYKILNKIQNLYCALYNHKTFNKTVNH